MKILVMTGVPPVEITKEGEEKEEEIASDTQLQQPMREAPSVGWTINNEENTKVDYEKEFAD